MALVTVHAIDITARNTARCRYHGLKRDLGGRGLLGFKRINREGQAPGGAWWCPPTICRCSITTACPSKALKHKTPIQALKESQEKKPELFLKRVYDHAELDT